jgi:hypothetical protein
VVGKCMEMYESASGPLQKRVDTPFFPCYTGMIVI